MKKLFQLHIDKVIVPDWSSDIYHSRLYPSYDACVDGCLTEELFAIGKTLWDRGDFTEDVEDLDCDDAEELKERYNAGDKEVMAYIQNVRQWLRNLSNPSFYGDGSMEWRILKFEVVNDA